MHFLPEEVTASPQVAGLDSLGFLTGRKKESQQKCQTGPREGSCHCQGSSMGTGIGAKPQLLWNHLGANIRGAVLWEQNPGAAGNSKWL